MYARKSYGSRQQTRVLHALTTHVQDTYLIDGEGSLDRAVGHDLSGNGIRLAWDGVCRGAKVLVGVVGVVVSSLARALACRRADLWGAGAVLARHVVIAVGKTTRTICQAAP